MSSAGLPFEASIKMIEQKVISVLKCPSHGERVPAVELPAPNKSLSDASYVRLDYDDRISGENL